jgi:hypothetical protein
MNDGSREATPMVTAGLDLGDKATATSYASSTQTLARSSKRVGCVPLPRL